MKKIINQWALYPFFIPLILIFNELRSVYFDYISLGFYDKLVFSMIIFFTNITIYVLAYLLLKNKIKAGILILMPLMFLDFYFDAFNYLIQLSFIKPLYLIIGFKVHKLALFFLSVITLLLFIYFRRSKLRFVKFNLYLNIVFGIFLCIEIVKYTSTILNTHELKLENTFNTPIKFTKNTDSLPDIYFVIFDSYTGNASLRRYWNYDNLDIQSFLIGKGFLVPTFAQSCYNGTTFSIPSFLNASYINIQNKSEADKTRCIDLVDLLRHNQISKELLNYGYKFQEYSIFNRKPKPDLQSFFIENLYYRTFFYLVQEKFFGLKNVNYSLVNESNFKKLLEVKKHESPVIHYAYFYMPHCPYLFDSTGKEIYDKNICYDCLNKEAYKEQLIYTNSKIKIITNHILKVDPKSIIIFQADHGFRFLFDIDAKDRREEGFSIFQAIYLPNKNYKNIADTTYSVNTFRYVFNNYFGTNLPVLKGKKVNVGDENEIKDIFNSQMRKINLKN
ncbi:MAG: hypothetical protein WCQ95_10580 [Bacteroidota bacterium]